MDLCQPVAFILSDHMRTCNDRRRLDIEKEVVKLREVLIDLLSTYAELISPFVTRDDPDIYFLSCHNLECYLVKGYFNIIKTHIHVIPGQCYWRNDRIRRAFRNMD